MEHDMVVSQNKGTRIETPKYHIVLILRTPKMVHLILGNPPYVPYIKGPSTLARSWTNLETGKLLLEDLKLGRLEFQGHRPYKVHMSYRLNLGLGGRIGDYTGSWGRALLRDILETYSRVHMRLVYR